MHEDPRERAFRQFAALLEMLSEMGDPYQAVRASVSEATTLYRETAETAETAAVSRPLRVMTEVQHWMVRHHRWVLGVLVLQMVAVVALMVAMFA